MQSSSLFNLVSSFPEPQWFLDSNVSLYVTNDLNNLIDITPYTGTYKVMIGNGKHLSISHVDSNQYTSSLASDRTLF